MDFYVVVDKFDPGTRHTSLESAMLEVNRLQRSGFPEAIIVSQSLETSDFRDWDFSYSSQ